MFLAAAAVVILVVVAATAVMYRASRLGTSTIPWRTHVVLVGASIGQDWRLAGWPERALMPGFTAESVAAWQFDKAEAINELLMRPARKFRVTRTYLKSLFQPPPPKASIVILKECSSYFPGDLPAYRDSLRRWAEQIQASGARLVLATVVPVTRTRAARDAGKQESLVEFNRWIREFARQEGIALLDLEAALRVGDGNSYLRDDFTSGDGSHLNAAAYAVLDKTLSATLCQVAPETGCGQAEAR